MSEQLDLFASPPEPAKVSLPDDLARRYAVDPANNVVLEASAGTGKTTVLVFRYLNLLAAGVDPANILAITFTRKAAAEMRERIIRELKRSATESQAARARWNALRDRLSDIAISTIDAFCLSLLREFPLEADLEPGFAMADETEVPRLIEESLDRALRIALLKAREDRELALVLTQLGLRRAQLGLSHLLARRLVAWQALNRFLASGPATITIENVCRESMQRLNGALASIPGGLPAFIADGPLGHPRFRIIARDLEKLDAMCEAPPAVVRAVLDRVRGHFLTKDGEPRKGGGIQPYKPEDCDSAESWRRHRRAIEAAAPAVKEAIAVFERDLNVLVARGIKRMFAIALAEYKRTLKERSVLDFSDVLEHALRLLGEMEEFAQSRYRLEGRYHHVLVDEFQDTSRAQWDLVSLLVRAWGEGRGITEGAPLPPSIFIVGDRKQSIYRFRDAEVSVLDEAARYIEALRPGTRPRQSITWSFRARPELLSFVNDVFSEIVNAGTDSHSGAFRFDERDRFPSDELPKGPGDRLLGVVAEATPEACAAAVADEIARVLEHVDVRDRDTGVARPARPGDVAILFRSRASHREFEAALEARHIPSYVYKGLGFFDADEIKDITALLRFLADPQSDLRAAALLRSRFIRVSDGALARLAPRLSAALVSRNAPAVALEPEDALVLERARARVAAWLESVDQLPPADLLDLILSESAYDYELRGPRRAQARENIKKMRTLVRRIQNRGYATMRRIAEHLDSLSAGDESNATLEAVNAVNLMTVHAAKGLEFQVVFVVNLAKGAGGRLSPVRVIANGDDEPSVSIASYISEADEQERDRECEETKRLLYVALTRARDRLYLATVLKDGDMRAARGSLGEVLPPSIAALFSGVEQSEAVSWTGPSGRTHELAVVHPLDAATPECSGRPEHPERSGRPEHSGEEQAMPPFDLAPVVLADGIPRVSVTQDLASAAVAGHDRHPFASADELMLGSLVHRLFQVHADPDDRAALLAKARLLVRPEERVELESEQRALERAADLYVTLSGRRDLADVLASGTSEYEVPFSYLDADRATILRGTIDCLVRRADGSIFVVEFKTGRPRPEHQRQLATYLAAARAIFPTASVQGDVFYPE